jgi:hypothetical protein
MQRGEPYRELGVPWFDRRHGDATPDDSVHLKALGRDVVVDPPTPPD